MKNWLVARIDFAMQDMDMPRTPIDEILSQSVADRLRAVDAIWDSIVADPALLPVSQSQRDELDRRLKLYREDPDASSSWEDVKARLLGGE